MEFIMLEYVALGIIIFVAITLFYGIIAIHDIPYEIAVHRNHPQQDALHVAGWISLFTLHVLWPFLWIWAMLYREDRGWGFSQPTSAEKDLKASTDYQLAALNQRVALLEQLIVSQYSATQDFQTEQENIVDEASGESDTSFEQESQGDK
jgi:hypothetical protein